jgi:hypothetical protein
MGLIGLYVALLAMGLGMSVWHTARTLREARERVLRRRVARLLRAARRHRRMN